MASFAQICGVLCIALFAYSDATATNCWMQKCHECPSKAAKGPGEKVECNVRNMVTMQWLDNPAKSDVPIPSELPTDFVCLKMVASDSSIVGDSTDVFRGCVPKTLGENICNSLIEDEQARGKKDATCRTCESDNCNGAFNLQVSSILLILSASVAAIKSF